MTKTHIQPLGNRVLIKRSTAQTSKGGILLPETAKEKPKEGTVIAVGPGKLNDEGKLEPTQLKAGDIVLFSSYSGTEVKTQDNTESELLILSEDDILGIIK
jgi:chaperonin GroES